MSQQQHIFRKGPKYLSKQAKFYRQKVQERSCFLLDRDDTIDGDAGPSVITSEMDVLRQSDAMETDYLPDNLTYSVSDSDSSDTESNTTDMSDEDDSSEEFDSSENSKSVLKDDLISWFIDSQSVTKSDMNSLLKVLKKHGISEKFDIPVDIRTFLGVNEKIDIKKVSGGDTVYLGIKRVLDYLVKSEIELPNVIICDVNLDGAEVFVNPYTRKSMWPVLMAFKNIKGIEKEVFPISYYCGSKKPENMEFLESFIVEYQQLNKSGYLFGERVIHLHLDLIRMDIPAHSMVCCTISHTGYESCFKCTIRGESYAGKITFGHIDEVCEKRTNESFREKLHPHHHTSKECNLLKIENFDIIKQVPLDVMHLVYLGVEKKLLKLWFFGRKNVPGGTDAILGKDTLERVSSKIKNIKGQLPAEFHRNLRSIECLNRYKAKEFRIFLFYIGPFVLKNILASNRYEHFLHLHCAIKIMSDDEFCRDTKMLTLAKKLIEYFLMDFETYGKEHMTINLHLLSHLGDEVERNGPVDDFSCFIFENFLGKMKRIVKSPNEPLKQIVRNQLLLYKHATQKIEKDEVIFHANNNNLYIKGVLLSSKFPNCFVLLKNRQVFEIKSMERDKSVTLKGNILKTEDFFKKPIHSSTINCFVAGPIHSHVTIELADINKKMVPFHLGENKYLVISNTHRLQ